MYSGPQMVATVINGGHLHEKIGVMFGQRVIDYARQRPTLSPARCHPRPRWSRPTSRLSAVARNVAEKYELDIIYARPPDALKSALPGSLSLARTVKPIGVRSHTWARANRTAHSGGASRGAGRAPARSRTRGARAGREGDALARRQRRCRIRRPVGRRRALRDQARAAPLVPLNDRPCSLSRGGRRCLSSG